MAPMLQVGQKIRIPVTAKLEQTGPNSFAGRTYPSGVVDAATAHRRLLAERHVPSRSETRAMIVAIARSHGLDPRLALAIGWQESGWNQREVSVADAIGVMQVIPSSGGWASDMAGRHLDLLNTRDNITAGVVILRSLTRCDAGPAQGDRRVLPGPGVRRGERDVCRHQGLRGLGPGPPGAPLSGAAAVGLTVVGPSRPGPPARFDP